jgi:hypothetical protein
MPPSSFAREKKLFQEPWVEEAKDPNFSFIYKPSRTLESCDDGDREVMRAVFEGDVIPTEEEIVDDDGLEGSEVAAALLEVEARDVITATLADTTLANGSIAMESAGVKSKYNPIVTVIGKNVYKSTLVNELDGNPFLSKDRLIHIKNSVYFNNAEDYITAAASSSTCLLGLGTDCGVFFANCDSTGTGSTSRVAKKRSGGARSGNPSRISGVGSIGKWWLRSVQKMRKKYGTRWGNLQQPVDLLSWNTNTSNVRVEVLLNWFSCARTNNKFKYDVCVIARKTCTIFRHKLSAKVFSKCKFKSFGRL